MKNRIISIGYLGIKRCYLNVGVHTAVERYCNSEHITIEAFDEHDIPVEIIEFDDEFCAYSVYAAD